jgi:hypothetical protein
MPTVAGLSSLAEARSMAQSVPKKLPSGRMIGIDI